ncbi:MAG: CCA tRNA nucleotidyltransferase [Acidobacteria bacterium]|nr:CCA tRNA nucleotidyltransferase [Acidobacteriota bacterium]
MQTPPHVAEIVGRLHANGRQAYLVGGCVRDILLNREPKDWDVATDAPPDELTRLFDGANQIGAHFGVVLWNNVEIATFRSDGPYSDGRRPDSVRFETNPVNDAMRRDFTINGLFFNTATNEVLDYVNGRADLANRLIRAIGDPTRRFAEDYLRMLRAVRFAARFGFDIEERTANAIRAHSREIVRVAAERTRDELTRILTEGHARRGFELLDNLNILEYILPEIKAMQGVAQPPEFHPEGDVWTHTLLMLEGLQNPPITLAWGVLLHDVGKPPTYEVADRIRFNGHAGKGADMAAEILGRLRYSTTIIETVRDLVAQHMKFIAVPKMRESTRKRFLRQPIFTELLELHRLDCESSHHHMETYDTCKRALAELPEETLRPKPLLTGSDLLALGFPEGPAIGKILSQIEDAQLEGTITTRQAAEAFALEQFPR